MTIGQGWYVDPTTGQPIPFLPPGQLARNANVVPQPDLRSLMPLPAANMPPPNASYSQQPREPLVPNWWFNPLPEGSYGASIRGLGEVSPGDQIQGPVNVPGVATTDLPFTLAPGVVGQLNQPPVPVPTVDTPLAAMSPEAQAMARMPLPPPPTPTPPPALTPPPGAMQPGAGIGATMGQFRPELASAPPQTPEEEQRRIGAWQQVYERAQRDPSLWLALVRAGTELLQPVPVGQTAGGHTGRAIQAGIDYWTQLGAIQNQNKKLQAETAKTEAETGTLLPAQVQDIQAQTTLRGAQTAETQADTELKRLDAKSKPELVAAQIDKMRKEGMLDDAKAQELQQNLKTNPAYQAAIVDELKARAYYYRQQGSAAGSHARFTQQRWQDLIQSHMADPDIAEMATKDPAAARAMAVQRANPEMYAAGAGAPRQDMTAEGVAQSLSDEYDAAVTAGKPWTKKIAKEAWIRQELLSAGYDKAIAARALARRAQQPQGQPQGQPQQPSGPSGSASPKPQLPVVTDKGALQGAIRAGWLKSGDQFQDESGNTYTVK